MRRLSPPLPREAHPPKFGKGRTAFHGVLPEFAGVERLQCGGGPANRLGGARVSCGGRGCCHLLCAHQPARPKGVRLQHPFLLRRPHGNQDGSSVTPQARRAALRRATGAWRAPSSKRLSHESQASSAALKGKGRSLRQWMRGALAVLERRSTQLGQLGLAERARVGELAVEGDFVRVWRVRACAIFLASDPS